VSAEINGEAIGKTLFLVCSLNQEFTALLSIHSIHPVVPAAAKEATPAAMAKILSSGLMAEAADAGLAGARCAVGAGAAAGAAAADRWAAGVAEDRKLVALGGVGTSGEPPAVPVGPPGGNVGNLMVGAAVGLGGKLMRTVSFLGWTRPVDFFSGSAPGLIGGMSAIAFSPQR
jgi:hypothetical protein